MNDIVRSAARVLDVMELLSRESEPLTLSNVSDRLSTPKSSTLMLLRTLVARGYALRSDNDRYELAPEFLAGSFGWNTDPRAGLIAAARPVLAALTQELGESSTFGILAGPGEAQLLLNEVAKVEVRWDSDISRRPPLYCTAIGRALLAGLPVQERERQLTALPRQKITTHTVTDLGQLLDIVERAARDGLTTVEEEFALGGTGVACPIFDGGNRLVAALNISCVSSRYPAKKAAIKAALMRGKADIELRLSSARDGKRNAENC